MISATIRKETKSQKLKNLVHIHKANKWMLKEIETRVSVSYFITHARFDLTVPHVGEKDLDYEQFDVFHALFMGSKGPSGGSSYPSLLVLALVHRNGQGGNDLEETCTVSRWGALWTNQIGEASAFVLRRLWTCHSRSERAPGLSRG